MKTTRNDFHHLKVAWPLLATLKNIVELVKSKAMVSVATAIKSLVREIREVKFTQNLRVSKTVQVSKRAFLYKLAHQKLALMTINTI